MKEPREIPGRKLPWLVDLREFGAGRRFFRTQTAARMFQSQFLDEQAHYGTLAFDDSREKRLYYLGLEQRCAAMGTTLDGAVAAWETTHRPAQDKRLDEAIRTCVEAKLAAGRRQRAVNQLRYSLESFARTVGEATQCSAIVPVQVEAWLANPDWSPRTRQGKLIDLRTFVSFCCKPGRAWMAGDPTATVERVTVDERPPGILTVAQAVRLLAATRKAAPRFLPFIVLALFAGVRPEEIKQLAWAQVSLDRGYVEIPAAVAKRVRGGRQRRLIKLQPNAIAWLRLGGDLPPVSWQDQFDRVRKAAGFEANARGRRGRRRKTRGEPWPKNAMRHSFCSYCLPVFGELKESEWAGHSPQIAIARYRELVTEEQAKAFWSIAPA